MAASPSTSTVLVRIIGQELLRPATYIMAALSGVIIQLTQGLSIFHSPVPYVVPVVVLLLTRVALKYHQRHEARLLALPAEHESPAFVMREDGRIVAAAGRTEKLFRERGIEVVEQLLGRDEALALLRKIEPAASRAAGIQVAIPHIIKLERRLEPHEVEEMQMHTIYGAQIIDEMIASGSRRSGRLELGRTIALNHHQRWDGKGYPRLATPDGEVVELRGRRLDSYEDLQPLAGKQVPQAALIVSLADKYDALRSPRQHKPAFSHEKTVAILSEDDRTGALAQDVFGPIVFLEFMKLHGQFAEIYDSLSDLTVDQSV